MATRARAFWALDGDEEEASELSCVLCYDAPLVLRAIRGACSSSIFAPLCDAACYRLISVLLLEYDCTAIYGCGLAAAAALLSSSTSPLL